jgi:hypothetical protein
MSNDILLIKNPLTDSAFAAKLVVSGILSCNKTTSRYGLTLSETEAFELAETRSEALCSSGRIEFSNGIINKLILEFCDSPYISRQNYVDTINELVEIFYYFKNETLDEIDDDDLITYLKRCFDNSCYGSLELLKNRELENLARNIRFGLEESEDIDDEFDEYMEDFYDGI